jgi:hypothetical protein
MFKFLLGVAVGYAAATAVRGNNPSTRSSATGGTYGRVDELSAAAANPPADIGTLNVGDGTPQHPSTSASDASSANRGLTPA